ncbi:hypothetical protein TNCV_2848001 [Trichonephila clavipes]|nr:hypothetical protein TNCV_2848001 [Trichonephila clavipes]
MPKRVAAVISNNGGYSGYGFWQEPHFTEVYKFNHLMLGQHVIYEINFVVLSLVFLGVAFTLASSVFQRFSFYRYRTSMGIKLDGWRGWFVAGLLYPRLWVRPRMDGWIFMMKKIDSVHVV